MNKTLLSTVLVSLCQVQAFESSSLSGEQIQPEAGPEDLMKIKHEYFKFVAEFGKQLATKE